MKTKLDIILDNWRLEEKITADEEAMDSLTRQVVELTAMVHQMTAEITGPPHGDPFGDCPACGDHSMRGFHEAGMGRPPLTVDSLLARVVSGTS